MPGDRTHASRIGDRAACRLCQDDEVTCYLLLRRLGVVGKLPCLLFWRSSVPRACEYWDIYIFIWNLICFKRVVTMKEVGRGSTVLHFLRNIHNDSKTSNDVWSWNMATEKESSKQKLDVADMKMPRRVCGATKLNEIRNEGVRGTWRVVKTTTKGPEIDSVKEKTNGRLMET